MRKVKHWLHILLSVLTSGLWLPIYLILLGTTEMYNRGYREGKAAGRVARQNEIDEERLHEKMPLVQSAIMYGGNNDQRRTMVGLSNRSDRYAELIERARVVGLDQYERAEFNQLSQELGR